MERSFYPLICMACGKRGAVSPEGLAKAASGSHSLRCKCGSDDIDLDTTPDAMQVSASVNDQPYQVKWSTDSDWDTLPLTNADLELDDGTALDDAVKGWAMASYPQNGFNRNVLQLKNTFNGSITTYEFDPLGNRSLVAYKTAAGNYSAPDPGWGSLYGASADVPSYITPQGPVWLFRNGQRCRFYNEAGEQVGPEQANVAPAVAYALSQDGWVDGNTLRGGAKTAEQKSYKPFCSLECNREYSSMVAAPDTANNTEPYCLNCGKPTEEMPKRASRKKAERSPEGSIVNAVMQWTYDDAEYRYNVGRISQEEFDAYTWLWANGAVRFGNGPGMSYQGLPLADLYPEAREIIEEWAADPAGGRVRDILSRVGTTASRKQAAVEVTVNPRRPSERVVTIVRQVGPGLYETDSGERVNYDNVQSRDMDALLGAFPEVWHNDTYPIEPVDGQGELHFASREAIAREILRTNPGLNPRLVERVASKTLARLQEKG